MFARLASVFVALVVVTSVAADDCTNVCCATAQLVSRHACRLLLSHVDLWATRPRLVGREQTVGLPLPTCHVPTTCVAILM